jgi:thymidylate synthase (FAD)
MEVNLITLTPEAEKIIGYCARVSNPSNQSNPDVKKLLEYCIVHHHWSVFEQAHMTVEITTSVAIATQILRHRSFNFQQFSGRYAKVTRPTQKHKARRQDKKNRQNSLDDLPEDTIEWFKQAELQVETLCNSLYQQALDKEIAKELARFLLPQSATTTMYMTGNLRSWIHYLDVRCDEATQLEHREIANEIKKIFVENFPIISKAKGWL